ncbi:adenosylcobinamide-GDP ribazoletransferase [Aquamicrobium lusatiense]|uniref:adenosylcobinamide-GDP ribazoletransferase n=1 Tax=Aquamicrobium lusatiense TaxID=89772 RepID=UPI002456CB90|nr:adenosylcobinamide-GDP ribazoletransferase [Aquamicrobium lusatiense]MDH4990490.1 adenosylcobinamide-GDP ribazoletransferase [Aquamicrobium lusatiense]
MREKLIPIDVALCIAFFTRLPLPHLDFRDRTLADAIWAAPIAGLAVALLSAAAYALGVTLGLPSGPTAALTLAAALLATGCLHEDGLSDVADGFGGGATRERKLEIMRDSNIGSYGTAALTISLLLRWSALAALAGPSQVFAALIAAHCASRALPAALMHVLPPARADGLSAGAGTVSQETALIGAVIGAVSLLTLGPGAALAALLLLIAMLAGFAALCHRQIGGQTGDTAGALQQFGEIAVLLVASAVLS